MRTTVEVIDLDRARKYLESNVPFTFDSSSRTNRPITMSRVNLYAKDMLLGRWMLTHSGIAFDQNGRLIDGQKRLLALILAATEGVGDLEANPNVTFTTQVTRDADSEVFEVIDTGETRNSYQILSMNGVRNGFSVASACRLLYLFDNVPDIERWRKTRLTNHEVLQIATDTELAGEVAFAMQTRIIGLIPSVALAGARIAGQYMPRRGFRGKSVKAFHNAIRTGLDENGEGLLPDDPRYAFREYLIRSMGSRRNRERRDQVIQLMVYIKVWNDYLNGRRRTLCMWKPTEGVIRPVGFGAVANGDLR